MRSKKTIGKKIVGSRLAGLGLAGALAAGGVLGEGASGQTYVITPPSGFTNASPRSLSGDGNVVYGMINEPLRSFRYTVAGGLVNLGGSGNAVLLEPGFCNYDGSITGVNLGDPSGSFAMGSRWVNPGTLTQLGYYFVGGDTQVTTGICGDGTSMFGQASMPTGGVRAYRWTASGGFTTLGALAGGFNSNSLGTSSDGLSIVGFGDSTGGGYKGFRWHPTTGMVQLNYLPGGENWTFARAVSDNGQTVVGSSGTTTVYASNRAVRWRALTPTTFSIEALGMLPGHTYSQADVVMRDGDIALGASGTANPNFLKRAVAWSSDLGMLDLTAWLPSVGVSLGGLTVLTNVAGISDDGRTIAGEANLFGGERRVYLIKNIPCWHRPSLTQDITMSNDGYECVGNTAIISAVGGGQYTGSLTYTWYRDGVAVVLGQTQWGSFLIGQGSPTLQIFNSQISDSAEYQCVITNACGAVGTSSVPLVVNSNVSIYEQPVGTRICAGGNGFVSVTMDYSGPTQPRYQWYYNITPFRRPNWALVNNGPTGSGTVFSGARSPVLAISSAAYDVETQFYCVVNNPCSTVTTDIVSVSLEYSTPVIFSEPYDTTTCPSLTGSLSVGAFDVGAGTYQWERLDTTTNMWVVVNDGPITWGGCGDVQGATTDTLSLVPNPVLMFESSGLFRCSIINACAAVVTQTASIYACPGDYNCDSGVDGDDSTAYMTDWSNAASAADVNCDGGIDGDDVTYFFNQWSAGC